MTKLVWHIDRAKFLFEDPKDYTEWKKSPDIFFEFSPSSADETGENLFSEAYDIEIYEQVTEPKSKISITLNDDGPIISAWVTVDVDTTEDFDEDSFIEWSTESGGWYAGSISLGDFDASITEDDGGDWRLG